VTFQKNKNYLFFSNYGLNFYELMIVR